MKFNLNSIPDLALRQNFKMIVSLFNTIPWVKGDWAFLTFTLTSSGTSVKIPHNLSYTPLDAVLLSVVGGSVTFNYNLFDSKNINVNATVTSSPMTVRMIVGRYSEDTVNV